MAIPYIDYRLIADLRGSADIVDEVSDAVIYMGWCLSGTTLTSQAQWSIMKIETVGTVTTAKWATGQSSYNQVWDDRAILTYTFRKF